MEPFLKIGEVLGQALLWLAGIVGASALIASKVVPFRRWLDARWDRVRGWFAGIVREQLNYKNAGQSMRDAVDRIDSTIGSLAESVRVLHGCVDELRRDAHERAADAKDRAERIEHRLDRLEDVIMRRNP